MRHAAYFEVFSHARGRIDPCGTFFSLYHRPTIISHGQLLYFYVLITTLPLLGHLTTPVVTYTHTDNRQTHVFACSQSILGICRLISSGGSIPYPFLLKRNTYHTNTHNYSWSPTKQTSLRFHITSDRKAHHTNTDSLACSPTKQNKNLVHLNITS